MKIFWQFNIYIYILKTKKIKTCRSSQAGVLITSHCSQNKKADVIINIYKEICQLWVPVSSTGKVSDGCIRNLEFNPYLHQKLIGVLV